MILAYLGIGIGIGIGIGLVCTGWATQNQNEYTPKIMMVAGFIFIGIATFLRLYLARARRVFSRND